MGASSILRGSETRPATRRCRGCSWVQVTERSCNCRKSPLEKRRVSKRPSVINLALKQVTGTIKSLQALRLDRHSVGETDLCVCPERTHGCAPTFLLSSVESDSRKTSYHYLLGMAFTLALCPKQRKTPDGPLMSRSSFQHFLSIFIHDSSLKTHPEFGSHGAWEDWLSGCSCSRCSQALCWLSTIFPVPAGRIPPFRRSRM